MKSRVKVCHVTSVHNRYDVRILHKECKSLADNGYEVTLLVNDDLKEETLFGVRIVSTGFAPKNKLERMQRSRNLLKKKLLELDCDICHFHDPELLPLALFMKKRGKRTVFDFHEDVSMQILHKEWIPKILRSLVSRVYQGYEKRIAGRLDALISVTPKFVERLKGVNLNTVMVTNYPVLKEDGPLESLVMKERAVCFAGGVFPQWNHDRIIEAILGIEDVRYLLAGKASAEYLESLKEMPGWNRVEFFGKIPFAQVKGIYDRSMVGMSLLSNDTQVGDEGTLGNTKIFEFMEAGLPVICSNNRLWKKLVEDHDCGIAVDPSDVEGIRAAVADLLEDKEKRTRMGANGRRAILSTYNWGIQEKELVELYGKLV